MATTQKKILLFMFFFVSGATSLSLEVAWSKELSYLLGVDLYASSTVVTAFMAGLGLGAIIIARFYRWWHASVLVYAILEIIIGAFGILSIPLFRSTLPLFSFLYDSIRFSSELFLMVRFLVVFILTLIPVTMMGMTLPIIVGAAGEKEKGEFSSAAGLFYGINTIGAVTGTIVAGFVMIPTLGILNTCRLTGLLDILIGLLALGLYRISPLVPDPSMKTIQEKSLKKQPPKAKAVSPTVIPNVTKSGFIFFFSGLIALVFEICWFRLLSQIIGPTVHAFSIMLVVYLLGIGIGSIIGASFIQRVRKPKLTLCAFLSFVGLGSMLTMLYVNHLPIWYGRLFPFLSQSKFTIWHLLIQGTVAAMLILPAILPSGALFAIVTRTYNDEILSDNQQLESSVGHLYFLNTLGGVIGCLLCGFWMVPHMGISITLLSGSVLSILLGAFVYVTLVKVKGIQGILRVGCGLVLIVGLILWLPGMDQTILNIGIYKEVIKKDFLKKLDKGQKSLFKTGRLLFIHEGINNNVAVMANILGEGNLTLHLSGHWVTTTQFYGRIHLHFLGHLPMLFARNPSHVAVIGFGAGITSGTILQYPQLKQIDIFEIEPGVIKASKYFDYINHRPLQDPRTRLITVDGRSHLTYNRTTYDVITSDPIHPFVSGAGNLFSNDFYMIARSRLNEGGIFCQWIPLNSISPQSYDTILASIHAAFPHMALFSCFGESIVLASTQPIQVNWEEFEKRFYSEKVLAEFKTININNPYNLFGFFEGGSDQLKKYLIGHTNLNTDDNVWLENQMAIDVFNFKFKNLSKMISNRIKPDGWKSLKQMLPGISIQQMEQVLANVPRNVDKYFAIAKQAFRENDLEKMEAYNRIVFSDVSSQYFYPAGLGIVYSLRKKGNLDEVFSILTLLQKKHPAFDGAYLFETMIYNEMGKRDYAETAVQRGLMYSPDNQELLKLQRTLAN